MRIIMISAFTLAVYAGPAFAQDQARTAAADDDQAEQTVDYARDRSRASSQSDRARAFARNAQRMAQQRAGNNNEAEPGAATPLQIDDAVISDAEDGNSPE